MQATMLWPLQGSTCVSICQTQTLLKVARAKSDHVNEVTKLSCKK